MVVPELLGGHKWATQLEATYAGMRREPEFWQVQAAFLAGLLKWHLVAAPFAFVVAVTYVLAGPVLPILMVATLIIGLLGLSVRIAFRHPPVIHPNRLLAASASLAVGLLAGLGSVLLLGVLIAAYLLVLVGLAGVVFVLPFAIPLALVPWVVWKRGRRVVDLAEAEAVRDARQRQVDRDFNDPRVPPP